MIVKPLLAVPPYALGYPGINAQSNYYPGADHISQEEFSEVSDIMEKHSIGPRNTRILKLTEDGHPTYHLLQASSEAEDSTKPQEIASGIFLVKGDHAEELSKICTHLEKAKQYASNSNQLQVLTRNIESFRTGSMIAFEESQKAWVKDVAARVENVMGFVEPYRDPAGIRAEWEGVVGIADPDEAASLKRLVDSSTDMIRQLPWALEGVNDGKGPFEKGHFESPDFTCLHGWSTPNLHFRELTQFHQRSPSARAASTKPPTFPTQVKTGSLIGTQLMPSSTTKSGRTTVSKTSFMRIALPSTTTRISLATGSSPLSSSASKPVRTLSDFSRRSSTSSSATEPASFSVKLSRESTTLTSRARPSALSLKKP